MLDVWEKLKEYPLIAGGVAVLVLLGSLVMLWRPAEQKEEAFPEVIKEVQQVTTEVTEAEISSAMSLEKEQEQMILVDVKGAVVTEGLYELPVEARVNDAIQKAGGFLEVADKKSVNLAQKLVDEAVVYVARQGEEGVSVAGSSSEGGSQAGSASHKVALNKATVADLTTISGIGEKRAQDIIAYREAKGKFSSVEELANVSGIGAKTLERIQAEVTLD